MNTIQITGRLTADPQQRNAGELQVCDLRVAIARRRGRDDELVEQLVRTEAELERVRRQHTREGIDPAWRQIANELAEALRPYSLFREQRVEDGRIVAGEPT